MYQIANANGVTLADGDTIDIELEELQHRRWVEGWISANQNLSLLLQVYGSDWITLETGSITSGTPVGFCFQLTARRGRLRISNSSGSTATLSYEANMRGEI